MGPPQFIPKPKGKDRAPEDMDVEMFDADQPEDDNPEEFDPSEDPPEEEFEEDEEDEEELVDTGGIEQEELLKDARGLQVHERDPDVVIENAET